MTPETIPAHPAPDTLRPGAYVAIDGDPASPGAWAAYLDPRGWNGWAVPYFDRAAVDRLIGVREGDDHGPALAWAPDGLTVLDLAARRDRPRETGLDWTPVLIGGTPYWSVGGGAWIWAEVETIPARIDGEGPAWPLLTAEEEHMGLVRATVPLSWMLAHPDEWAGMLDDDGDDLATPERPLGSRPGALGVGTVDILARFDLGADL